MTEDGDLPTAECCEEQFNNSFLTPATARPVGGFVERLRYANGGPSSPEEEYINSRQQQLARQSQEAERALYRARKQHKCCIVM